ncbi:MAG: hypothetical protein ABF628_01410, partial [Acetobacter orientalis]|uniref:hypothetical protein n=1 Tax=Acetobacter orientalis TaxID=146474 RepID=UPI0039EAE312
PTGAPPASRPAEEPERGRRAGRAERGLRMVALLLSSKRAPFPTACAGGGAIPFLGSALWGRISSLA